MRTDTEGGRALLARISRIRATHPVPGSVLAVLVVLVVLVALLGGSVAASVPSRAATADTPSGLSPPLVIVGVGGLAWIDVTPAATPTLWKALNGDAGAAAVTVYTGESPVCAVGGWLALSAGRAIASPHVGDLCAAVPPVEAGTGSGARIPGWRALTDAQSQTAYEAHLGTLGDALAAGGVCATAVGPGAALALATSDGSVARYAAAVTDDAFGCPVTVVDAGLTSDLDGSDADVRAVDATVAAVLDAAPSNASVLVMSVSTPVGGRLSLGTAVAVAPAIGRSYLTTSSTRWDGVVRLLDVPSTILDAVDLPEPRDLEGAPVITASPRPGAAATAVRAATISTADDTLRRSSGLVVNLLGGAAIALLLFVVVRRPRTRSGLVLATVASAYVVAFPIAAMLVSALRWWNATSPFAALWVGMAVLAAVLALAALGAGRLTPGHPAYLLAALGAVVLAVDVVLGSPLHRGSPFGPSPIFGGRYYGFGNSTYAIFTVYVLVAAAGLGYHLVRVGRPRAAVFAIAGVGVVAVLADVWPTWGADVGGGLALAPAFVVLALVVARVRVTPLRGVLALAAGVLMVAFISILDWLRPAQDRSHAGRFVQQVIDGDAWAIVARKAGYAWRSLGSGLPAWLTIALVVGTLVVLWRPARFTPADLRPLLVDEPWLPGLVAAVLVGLVFGGFVNDYGIRIATIGAGAAVPLLALACTIHVPGGKHRLLADGLVTPLHKGRAE